MRHRCASNTPSKTLPDPRITLSSDIKYAKIWIRSEGFPQASDIRYFSDGVYKTTPVNADWTAINIEAIGAFHTLSLPESSPGSKVWIDRLSPIQRAWFGEHPQDVATYLGATVRFKASAYEQGASNPTVRWTKDGQPVSSDQPSQLTIDSVSLEDLGTYQARAQSSNGEIVTSRAATLSLLSSELATAIGYTGARITTSGYQPWKVDFADSVDGASSIVSGALELNESTEIEIEIDGPAVWGIYKYEFDDVRPSFGKWNYASAPIPSHEGSSKLVFRVTNYSYYGVENFNPALRIDGVRLAHFSNHSYEQWIQEKLAGLTVPFADDRTDRSADPDRDGLPNWLEFALGLDPASPSLLPTTGIAQAEDGSHVAKVELYAARSNEYSVIYEVSVDLENWFSIKPTLKVVSSTFEYDHIQANFQLETPSQSRYFVRWKIQQRNEKDTGTFQ